MTSVFSQVLNMSLTGSVVILVVILGRQLLKRFPKIYAYALWSVVLFRLLCPISISGPVSLLDLFRPQVTDASETTSVVQYLRYDSTAQLTFVPAQPAPQQTAAEIPSPQHSAVDPMVFITGIWLAGAAVMVLHSGVPFFRLRRKLTGAIYIPENVYIADHIGSPFVMGLLRPRIYLPSDIPPQERIFIIAHERHHIRRFDHVTRLLAYGALCIHWFNPLVWAAFILAGRDMEMSCDEAVIRRLGPQIRADYSYALLRLATHRKIIAGTPLAFGEGDTKGRVMNMAKWKKPGLWASIVCVVLCAAVLVACATNPKEKEALEDMTRTYGPASVGVGELFYTLPEGYSIEMQESANQPGGNITQYEQVIKKDDVIIGGVVDYPTPEMVLSESNSGEWFTALGLWEAAEDSLGYMGGSSAYGDYEMNYFSDVPPGEAITVNNHHTFFITEDIVYDIWFDKLVADDQVMENILRSVTIGDGFVYTETMPSDSGAEGLIAYSPLTVYLPHGIDHRIEADTLFFTIDGRDIGGIISYPIPEGVYDPSDKTFFWLEKVGIPDFDDPSLCYMGGITSRDSGWAAEFASDVPEGTAPTVYRRHHFYPIGDTVYDVWFDLLRIDYNTCGEILSAVSLPDYVPSETADRKKTAEETAFEACRTVMDTVQNSSYHIASQWTNDGGNAALNDRSSTQFYQHDGNTLSITEIPEDGGLSIHGHLAVEDVHYDNQGNGWSEDGKPLWKEETHHQDFAPWLDSFVWVKSHVAYIDTMTDESGTCYMYRIDFPYEAREDYDDHYFVNFYFDSQGSFRYVSIQVNLFRSNAFTVTESILSLEEWKISAVISGEYRRAVEPTQ